MTDPEQEDPSPRPGDGYVQSFARGLAVLRSFGAGHAVQTLSEAAQRTGLTRAGARRILLTLEHLGYVEQEGRGFRLTPKVLELGFAYLSSQPIWQLAQPVIEEVVGALNESCSAAVLDGDEVVYVLRVPGRKIVSIHLGVGTRLPAYCTALGRVLLAALPEAKARRRLAAHPLEARTPKTETDPERLLALLAEARRDGHALVDEELELGLVSIAVPVRNHAGRVIAAVNVSGQRLRTPPALMRERMLPVLRDAAARIDRLIAAQA